MRIVDVGDENFDSQKNREEQNIFLSNYIYKQYRGRIWIGYKWLGGNELLEHSRLNNRAVPFST